jgi:hypothetical protein
MQGFKSATTYAKRIGLESLSGVAPEDDDGNAAAKAAPRYVTRVEVYPVDMPAGVTNKEVKEAHARMLRMLQACNTLDDMSGWLTVNQDDLAALPEDTAEDLRGRYKRRRDELKAVV